MNRVNRRQDSAIDARTLAALAITLVFWASAFTGIRAGLQSYSPGSLALLRFLTASAALVVYAAIKGLPRPSLRDAPAMAFLAFLGITFYHVTLNYGEVTVTAGSASFLIGMVPVFSALLAVPVLGERLSLRAFFGIGISFAGVALIALGEGEGAGITLDYGALLILASALATSIFFVFQKPYLQKYGALPYTIYSIWIGTVFMMWYLPSLVSDMRGASLGSTLWVVYLGLFPSAVSYMAWAYALSRAPVSNVTSFLYVSPAFACLIAWFGLGEVPSVVSLVGGASALAGVALVNTAPKRRS